MLRKYNQRTKTKERRGHIRSNKSLTVTLCPSKYLLKNDFLTKDISEGGICLLTRYKMEIGENVNLGIYLPGSKKPALAVGKVVRRNETNDIKFPFLLGIEFTEIDSDAYQQIRNNIRYYLLTDQ